VQRNMGLGTHLSVYAFVPAEEHSMNINSRFSMLFLGSLILSIGTGQACAQSSALDETAGPDGIAQSLQLTPVQKSAIYNAVMQQRVHSSSERIATKIGAPVPPSAALYDLPDQAELGADADSTLKYAMVEGEIVVIDPISMRVVDVIGHEPGR
jgi:hypothetical protein